MRSAATPRFALAIAGSAGKMTEISRFFSPCPPSLPKGRVMSSRTTSSRFVFIFRARFDYTTHDTISKGATSSVGNARRKSSSAETSCGSKRDSSTAPYWRRQSSFWARHLGSSCSPRPSLSIGWRGRDAASLRTKERRRASRTPTRGGTFAAGDDHIVLRYLSGFLVDARAVQIHRGVLAFRDEIELDQLL